MSLVVWLPLNGSLENQGYSTINTFSYNNFTVQSDGKIGKCCSGQAIYHLENEILDNTWSLCAWVKSGGWSQYNDIILCKNTSSSDSCQFYFSIINGASLNLGINNNGGTVAYSYTFSTGIWYHIAATFDGSKYALYINGEQKKSGTVTTTLKTGMNNLGINCRSTNANGTSQVGDGGKKLNDVRIYDHCLSPLEVKEISQGLVLHYKLDDPYIENTTNLSSTSAGGWNNSGTCVRTTNDTTILNPPTSSNTYSVRATSDGSMALTCGTTNSNLPSKTIIASTYIWLDGTQDSSTVYLRSTKTDGSVGYLKYKNNSNPSTWPQRQWIRINTDAITTASDATTFYICTYINKNTEVRAVNGWQIEEKDHVTPWTAPNTTRTTGIVQDSSGYNNNGTINGALSTSGDSPRYNCSSYMPTATKIIHPRPVYGGTDQEWTCMMWVKLDGTAQAGQQLNNFNSGNNIVHGANGYPLLYLNSGTNDYYNYGNLAVSANTWTHIAFVFKNSNVTKLIYINGVNRTNTNGPNKTSTPAGISDTVTIGTNLAGYISDYRIYCTALSAADIQLLYSAGARADNLGGLHVQEFEEGTRKGITTQRILHSSNLYESGYLELLHYDKSIYTEPDGTTWVRIFHHNDPTTNGLFASTDSFETSVYKDANRWYDIEPLMANMPMYEFLVVQKNTSSSEIKKYRWIQNINPLEATFEDVKPGTITINTNSGYSTSSSYGGLYKMNTSARLCITKSASSSWWGIGSWTTYGGGTVGYPDQIVTTGYIDLYIRIYTPIKFIKNTGTNALNFIEI